MPPTLWPVFVDGVEPSLLPKALSGPLTNEHWQRRRHLERLEQEADAAGGFANGDGDEGGNWWEEDDDWEEQYKAVLQQLNGRYSRDGGRGPQEQAAGAGDVAGGEGQGPLGPGLAGEGYSTPFAAQGTVEAGKHQRKGPKRWMPLALQEVLKHEASHSQHMPHGSLPRGHELRSTFPGFKPGHGAGAGGGHARPRTAMSVVSRGAVSVAASSTWREVRERYSKKGTRHQVRHSPNPWGSIDGHADMLLLDQPPGLHGLHASSPGGLGARSRSYGLEAGSTGEEDDVDAGELLQLALGSSKPTGVPCGPRSHSSHSVTAPAARTQQWVEGLRLPLPVKQLAPSQQQQQQPAGRVTPEPGPAKRSVGPRVTYAGKEDSAAAAHATTPCRLPGRSVHVDTAVNVLDTPSLPRKASCAPDPRHPSTAPAHATRARSRSMPGPTVLGPEQSSLGSQQQDDMSADQAMLRTAGAGPCAAALDGAPAVAGTPMLMQRARTRVDPAVLRGRLSSTAPKTTPDPAAKPQAQLPLTPALPSAPPVTTGGAPAARRTVTIATAAAPSTASPAQEQFNLESLSMTVPVSPTGSPPLMPSVPALYSCPLPAFPPALVPAAAPITSASPAPSASDSLGGSTGGRSTVLASRSTRGSSSSPNRRGLGSTGLGPQGPPKERFRMACRYEHIGPAALDVAQRFGICVEDRKFKISRWRLQAHDAGAQAEEEQGGVQARYLAERPMRQRGLLGA